MVTRDDAAKYVYTKLMYSYKRIHPYVINQIPEINSAQCTDVLVQATNDITQDVALH